MRASLLIVMIATNIVSGCKTTSSQSSVNSSEVRSTDHEAAVADLAQSEGAFDDINGVFRHSGYSVENTTLERLYTERADKGSALTDAAVASINTIIEAKMKEAPAGSIGAVGVESISKIVHDDSQAEVGLYVLLKYPTSIANMDPPVFSGRGSFYIMTSGLYFPGQ